MFLVLKFHHMWLQMLTKTSGSFLQRASKSDKFGHNCLLGGRHAAQRIKDGRMRARDRFATWFSVNNKLIERKKVQKLLGVWLQEDRGWQTNTEQFCKKAYARLNMLTKLRYSGVCTEELNYIY